MFHLDVLDQLDLHDVQVVGHSLGGWIAAEMAVRDESRIKSLHDQALADRLLAREPTPQQIDECGHLPPAEQGVTSAEIINQHLARQHSSAKDVGGVSV
jgi:pimeloyl-ACP methyl ester carboxylesterase